MNPLDRYVCLIVTLIVLLKCGFLSGMPVEHNGMDDGQPNTQLDTYSNNNAPLHTCPTYLEYLRASLVVKGKQDTYFIDKNNVFDNMFQQVMEADAETLRKSPDEKVWFIENMEYDLVDTKDLFTMLSKELTESSHGLFEEIDAVTNEFRIKASSDAFKKFEFVGRIFGMAVLHDLKLGVHFVPSIFKQIQGEKMTIEDLYWLEHYYYRQFSKLLSEKIDGDSGFSWYGLFLTPGNCSKNIKFIPGGKNIKVQEETKNDVVHAMVNSFFDTQYQQQIDAIREGLYYVIPKEQMSQIGVSDLSFMISGPAKKMTVEVLKGLTKYDGYDEESRVIVWFWECLSGWNKQQLRDLLELVTGSPIVYPGGWSFVIKQVGQLSGRFYTVEHKTLGIPNYSHKDELSSKVLDPLSNLYI